MSIVSDDLEEGCDRPFFTAASVLAEPFCWVYETFRYRLVSPLGDKFDNRASKVHEFAIRCFIGLGAMVGCVMGTHIVVAALTALTALSCLLFRCIGVAMQKNGFSYTRGEAPEKAVENRQLSAMVWNIRGTAGGISHKDGVVHWRSRFERILAKINEENPDLLVLQGVKDTALEGKLVEQLKESYAHIFSHCGAKVLGSSNGTMVFAKSAIHDFTHTNNFETLELKAQPDDETPFARFIIAPPTQEWPAMMDTLKAKTVPLPTFFAGHTTEAAAHYLYDCYEGSTHTPELAKQWSPQVTPSGENTRISLCRHLLPNGSPLPTIEREVRLLDSHLVKAYDDKYDTRTALSSDQGLVAHIGLPAIP